MKAPFALALLGVSAVAVPCCSVAMKGAPVRFVGQTNIVVWDAAHGVEHFVRDARFSTTGASLAFIAPSHGKPTLSEANARAFESLEALKPQPAFAKTEDTATAFPGARGAGAVEVVGVQDVAGYRATVLRSTDAGELARWLRSNGYPSPPFLTKWAAPYVRRGWYFTAFKVNGDATGPVRMSFPTDRPFNPYSVPAENGGSGVPLRLYYVSAGGEIPKVGGTDAWRKAEWSADVPEETRASLVADLKLAPGDLPEGARVTAYQDHEFGKPGLDDLYFVPDHSVRNAALGGAAALVALAAGLRLRRRNRRAAHPS